MNNRAEVQAYPVFDCPAKDITRERETRFQPAGLCYLLLMLHGIYDARTENYSPAGIAAGCPWVR
jgi:hypothetical protein